VSRKSQETRHRILKAALDLLEAGQGHSGVRMSDIAKQADVSRQTLYLHFKSRSELLVATTHYLDDLKGGQERLGPSRAAESGVERLDAFIEAWTSYIPDLYGAARTLLAMRETDQAAAAAWDERMNDMREGCEAAINALRRDGTLSPEYSVREATDILWTLLSVRNFEQLTLECHWSQSRYTQALKSIAQRLFVTHHHA
jgi:AcrR family transcriptional regulator